MSRCFPYPPLGYEMKNGGCDKAALIKSIKLEKERGKSKKEQRKEKKKDKKEKNEKKEKARLNGEIEKEKKHSHDKGHKDKRSKVDQKKGECPNKRADETEQLEKSGLTEEHGQPTGSQNLYDSSDSTQNSNKRKRQTSSSDGIHNHRSVLRIRLPLLKHKDSEALPSKEQPCAISGRTDFISQDKYAIAPIPNKEQPCSTSGRYGVAAEENNVTATGPNKEHSCFTSGKTEILVQQKVDTAPSFSIETGPTKIESQYRDLFQNWAPHVLQFECTEFDDQEWLFDRKQLCGREAKQFKASDIGSCLGSCSLAPRACYLREADIYALPYTIPF